MLGRKHILDGLRVIEWASLVFVPAAAAILPEFSAEVKLISLNSNTQDNSLPSYP